MKIQLVNIFGTDKTSGKLKGTNKSDVSGKENSIKGFKSGLDCIANYNKANISFKGYFGDWHPAIKLFWIATGRSRNEVFKDNETDSKAWRVDTSIGQKAWSTIPPRDLLKRNLEQAIQSICTLNNTYEIPECLGTPNYGDDWGRRANYIEINPRLIAKTEGNKISEGIINMIKILPAIPPSTKSIPCCVILSQVYPTFGTLHDGCTDDVGVYCMEIKNGISKNLLSNNLERAGYWASAEEQVKGFNDLAHFRGLKTGVRMPISADQMTVGGRHFNWNDDLNAYIEACCWLVDLGFDAIYLDSGKHVGGYDMGAYAGVGAVPSEEQMQKITYEIRQRTGRPDIAFVAEKTDTHPRYQNLGYTAGTDFGCADNRDSLWHEYHKQKYNPKYAAGPIISDDNDNGAMTYEQRLERLRNAFSSFDDPMHKLPVHLQMHDLFPLKEDTNTHETMMKASNRSRYGDGANESDSHYNNVFANSDAAFWHTMNMYKEFEKIMDK